MKVTQRESVQPHSLGSTQPVHAALIAVIMLLFSASGLLFAQETGASVPYVSRLRTDVEGSAIKLLWQDSSIPGVKYVIYRSTEEITSANLKGAQRLAVVPAGQQTYIDRPTDKKAYFYAVLIEDSSGKVNDLFIPFRNVTTNGVSVSTLAGQQPAYADITSLKANLVGTQVRLTFKATSANRELVIYRNTSPMRDEAELLGAVSIGVIPSSKNSFEDTPVPGIPYYYAVIDTAMLADGKVSLAMGENSTNTGVEVPIQTNASGQVEYAPKRPRPLPFLTLNSNLQTGARLAGTTPSVVSQATPLTKSTSTAVDGLLGTLGAAQPPQVKPTILDPERGVVASGGEEYTLKNIVDGVFTAKDWSKSIDALNGYLNIRHSKPVESRARFYLGEAYYFAGDYRKSFLEFLFVENELYTEVQPWMDALFTKLGGTP